jgi:DNA-binding MarR family transcriptional regulator
MNEKDRFAGALGGILELVVLLNDDMTKSLAKEGLTGSRAHLLWVLRERGPLTQRELAEALQVSARNITGLVDALVATGFVTREAHPTDRRATLVSFTKQGAAASRQLERDREEFAELLFGDMPRDRFDAFVDGLGEVLTRLAKAGLKRNPEVDR